MAEFEEMLDQYGICIVLGNYGSSGMAEFEEMLDQYDICIASAEKVKNEDDADMHDHVVRQLLKTESAHVVVCFCEGLTIRRLLNATQRLGAVGRLLFLGR